MIFDVILAAIFIVMIAVNVHRGAAKALAGILSGLIAYLASTALGVILADVAYNAFLRPAVADSVSKAVTDVSADAAGSIVDSLPSWLSGLLSVSGGDINKLLEQPVSNVSDTVGQAVDTAIKPVAIGFLTFFITIILFLLLFIILRFLIGKVLNAVFRAPILNGINKFFGGVIGFVSAFLLVSMLAYLVKLILSGSGTRFGWFSESTIYNSFIFYHFYSGNIFSWVGSLITG